ncbi:MAG: GNAT family N-acetyltransferase [bacterium]|nr:GNAT family N-acetyltransferase [bacterium]
MSGLPSPYALRRARPQDIPAIIDLADRVFRPDRTSSMGAEFPLFLGPDNAHNIFVASYHSDIVAILGLFYTTLLLPYASLPVAMIGAVATDPLHRGRGLAGALLDAALNEALVKRTAVVFISGDRALYRRRGACSAGYLIHYLVPFEAWHKWQPHPSLQWRPYAPSDAPHLFRLHSYQLPRFARTLNTMDAVIRAQPCGLRTFTACRNGTPVAYAVLKPVRETATVSEFNGDPASFQGIPTCLPSTFTGTLSVLLPPTHPLGYELRRFPLVTCRPAPFDGTLLWSDFSSAMASLLPHCNAHAVPPLHGEQLLNGLALTDRSVRAVLSPSEMCAALWGAPDAPALPLPWQSAFPLPLCPYGLDFI